MWCLAPAFQVCSSQLQFGYLNCPHSPSLSSCFRVNIGALLQSKSKLGSHSFSQWHLCVFLKRNGRQQFHVFLSFKQLVVKLKVEQGRYQILDMFIRTTSVLRKYFLKILGICNYVICKYQGFVYIHWSQKWLFWSWWKANLNSKGTAMANSRAHHYLTRLTEACGIYILLN